jgi:hypothetical protein
VRRQRHASFAFRKEIAITKALDENKSHFKFGGFEFREEMEMKTAPTSHLERR